MEINILLVPSCRSVFLIDGDFFEGDNFVMSADAVLYLTVLPLDARFMPYTVKLVGAQVAANADLAFMCRISGDTYALKLGKRLGFVYEPGHVELPEDPCAKLFYLAKGRHFFAASELMTSALSSTLSDEDLFAFFKPYVEIVRVRDRYYVAMRDGSAHPCDFEVKNGKVDNISIDG